MTTMNGRRENTTATLSIVVGICLLNLNGNEAGAGSDRERQAREVAVLSRVLQNRLTEMRRALAVPEESPPGRRFLPGDRDDLAVCASDREVGWCAA
jgi:hypothetical protein